MFKKAVGLNIAETRISIWKNVWKWADRDDTQRKDQESSTDILYSLLIHYQVKRCPTQEATLGKVVILEIKKEENKKE